MTFMHDSIRRSLYVEFRSILKEIPQLYRIAIEQVSILHDWEKRGNGGNNGDR